MRTFENDTAHFVAASLTAAAFILGAFEAADGFDPAHVAEQQVTACAPNVAALADTGTTVLAADCKPFIDDLIQVSDSGVTTYDRLGRDDFVAELSPSEHYNRNTLISWAGASLLWGTVAAGGLFGAAGTIRKRLQSKQTKELVSSH